MRIGKIIANVCSMMLVIIIGKNTRCSATLLSWILDRTWPTPDTSQMKQLMIEAAKTTPELIRLYGYPVEEYTVRTDDNYLLGLHRIPGPNNGKKPILILHGILSSSLAWVDNGEESLAFVLADEGYDVWLGNLRGNAYSRKHEFLPENDDSFWNFSLDEMALYDLPAMIDFILNKTGSQKIILHGYSMGSTVSAALLSTKLEYNSKLSGLVLFAPIVSLAYTTTFIYKLALMNTLIKTAVNYLGVKAIMDQPERDQEIALHACGTRRATWCFSALVNVAGYSPYLYNKTRLVVYGSHFHEPIPIGILEHYAQMLLSKKYSRFDYGEEGNLKNYGKSLPPAYNLSLVTAPTAVFWSVNDALSAPVDAAILLQALPNLVLNYRIPDDLFNHHNYMWTTSLKPLVSNELIKVLNEFSNKDA